MTSRRHPHSQSPDLGWLRGFPRGLRRGAELPWLSFPPPGRGAPSRLVVCETRLLGAGRALDAAPRGGAPQRRRAQRQHAQLKAVEALVAAPSLSWNLAETHQLPTPQATVWIQSPALAAFARSLAWVNLGSPRALQRIQSADRHAPEIAAILEAGPQPRLRAALALADLLPDLERELLPLLLVLRGNNPRLARSGVVALDDLARRLKLLWERKASSPSEAPAKRPASTPCQELLATLLLRLHALPRPARHRSARALAALPPFERERRQAFWDRCASLERSVEGQERIAPHRRISALDYARLRSRLAELRCDAPLAYLDAEALDLTTRLAARPAALNLLLQGAAEQPLATRAPWFQNWLLRLESDQASLARRAIPVAARWFSRSSSLPLPLRSEVLQNFDHVLTTPALLRRNLQSLEAFLEAARGLANPTLPPLGFWEAGVRDAAERNEPPACWGRAVVELLLRRPEAWTELKARSHYWAPRILTRVCGSDADALAALLGVLHEADLGVTDEGYLADFVDSLTTAPAPTGRRLAFQFLTLESLSSLVRLGLGARTYAELRNTTLALPSAPNTLRSETWIQVYPAAVHDLLKALNRVDPRAQSSAARVLRKELPSASRLQREIQALEGLVAAHGTEGGRYQRLLTLRNRLSTTTIEVEPSRLRRARRLLEDRLRRAHLVNVEGALLDALRAAFACEVPCFTREWLEDTRLRPFLLHLALLEEDEGRPQAWRLLRTRLGPGPWDLREDFANRRFVARLEARGLDLTPWVEGTQATVREGPTGPLVLGLENDPLEVLRMGDHFQTCLSPGDINYYSALSNALDINKRVLYARDLQGRVVGRCLLALGDEGGLVAHHPYAHDGSLGFDLLVADFVRDLAGRIGSHPVADEPVSLLVAQEWYDDSPVDICETEAFLRDSASPFRQALMTMDSRDLLTQLSRACGGPPPPGVVSGLLRLPELALRPELSLALVHLTRGLNREDRLSLAFLTRRAGLPEASDDLVRSLVRRRRGEPEHLRRLAEELLARGQPGPALRLIIRHGALPVLETRAREALSRPPKPLSGKNLKI